jgi:hypothetical protein
MVNSRSWATARGAVAAVTFFAVALVAAPEIQAADASSAAAARPDAFGFRPKHERSVADGRSHRQRLNAARSDIETQTGASTYTITSEAIAAQPGGENVSDEPGPAAGTLGGAGLLWALHVRATITTSIPPERRHPARGHQRLQSDLKSTPGFLAQADHRRPAGGIPSAHCRHHRHHDQR